MATGPPFDKLPAILRQAQDERRNFGTDHPPGVRNRRRGPSERGSSPDSGETSAPSRSERTRDRRRKLQGRKPAANAASREAKWTLCSGFVRRPGGQFGRQKMCVVVQPFRVMSLAIILALATRSSRRTPSNIKLTAYRERLASILDCLMRRQTDWQPEGPSSCDLAASVGTIRRRN